MEKAFEDNPVQRYFLMSRAQVHGCDNPYDLLREYEHFDYRDLAAQITTPCLITDNPFDFATRGKGLYDCLKSVTDKTLITFVDEHGDIDTGGGAHCEQGYNLQFEIQVYNWIADTIGFDEQI